MPSRRSHRPHAQQSTQSQIKQTQVRHEIASCRIGLGVAQGCHKGQTTQHAHGQGVRATWRARQCRSEKSCELCTCPPRPPRRHPRHQQRQPHIELFLHGQRPEMLERAGGLALGMVVDRPADGHPVFGVHRAGGHVGRNHLPSPPRYPHVRCSTDGDPRQAGGRQQAPGAAGVKAGQVYSSPGPHFPHEVPGSEVAGYDEKDVHADVAARDPGRPDMEGQDQEDGNGAQGLMSVRKASMSYELKMR